MNTKNRICQHCEQEFVPARPKQRVCDDCLANAHAERNRRAREKAQTVPVPVERFLERRKKSRGGRGLIVVNDPLKTESGLSAGLPAGQYYPRTEAEAMISGHSFSKGSILEDPIHRKYIVVDGD